MPKVKAEIPALQEEDEDVSKEDYEDKDNVSVVIPDDDDTDDDDVEDGKDTEDDATGAIDVGEDL